MKQHPAGSISAWRSPLYICCAALLFLLGLAPGRDTLQWPAHQPGNWMELLPTFPVQGNVNNGTHWFLWSELFPQLLKTSCGSLTFSMWSISPVCCTEAIQLAQSYLSGGKYVHLMCSCEGANSASTYATILDLSLKNLRYWNLALTIILNILFNYILVDYFEEWQVNMRI